MSDQTYTMNIEVTAGEVKQHGFHLGTDLKIAEEFVFEKLNEGALSVALYQGGKLVRLYVDFRDLGESK